MLEKTFDTAAVEARITKAWEAADAFKAGRADRAGADPYCIVIPPPNVTGSLHMGHALNNTLQDILCRFERMRGKDVLWQVGTDHAGIATQMVVERKLAAEKKPDRRTMGREAFLAEVWNWKAESGGTIVNQLKRLGASCDWSRERFTMDEGLSKAVLKVFVELYNKKLIYKDKRLVNWDPKLLTAISDLEVVQQEVKGKLYYFRYPIEGSEEFITVATTRPETMLGDSGVAVHPEDERYRHLVGKMVRLPLVGRLIPIVADDYSDPEKGTGAVKITPAHDFNDFEVGKRHGLKQINVLDIEGKVLLTGNDDFAADATPLPEALTLHGLDRFEARKRVVAWFEEAGLLEKIEENVHQVPHGDRSGVVIEPYLTDQWYVDAHTLAQPALAAVREGRTTFVPKNWEKTYFDWLENIQPWCISRQLWWGHQIPAWYGPRMGANGALDTNLKSEHHCFVALSEEEVLADAREYYRGYDVEVIPFNTTVGVTGFNATMGAFDSTKKVSIYRDPDVLDTWFSSALWPFSTLGWPDDTKELKKFYPTNVLVTGFDIIFFWVARMMMFGIEFMETEPFKDVYIHALVRDEKGAKMSKSKGNVIDPLDLIEQFGADALRFTLTAMAAQGRDIKLSTQRVEGYRNFTTKLWNAARFCEMNECSRVAGFDPAKVQGTLARWIVGETEKAVKEVEGAILSYRFNDAANGAYRFVWNIFCDWFLEFAKPVFDGDDLAAKAEIKATAAWVLDQILTVLHPFMPFITEELWVLTGETGTPRSSVLALAEWPKLDGLVNAQADSEIGLLVELISAIRSVRAEMNVPPGVFIALNLVQVSAKMTDVTNDYAGLLKRLARLSDVTAVQAAPKGSVQLVLGGDVVCLPLAGIIDISAETARLAKEKARALDDIARVDNKLGNANFVARAPEEVIEGEKEKREEASERLKRVEEALARLADMG